MAEGDSPLNDRDHLHREGLVDPEDIDLSRVPADLAHRFRRRDTS